MINPALLRIASKPASWAALALLIGISALPKNSTLFFTWPLAFYGQLLLILSVLLLGWQLVAAPERCQRNWNVLAAAALAIAISVVFSRRPAFSLEAALFLFGGLAWCGLAACKASALHAAPAAATTLKFTLRLVGLALFVPLLAGLAYWLQDWHKIIAPEASWSDALRTLYALRNQHPFGHWNYTGGFVLLALPWFGALIWIERGRWQTVWLVGALAAIVMFFSASSRGAVLGALAVLGAAFGGAVATKTISRKQIGLLAVAGCVLAAGLWTANPRLRAVLAAPAGVLQPNEGDVQRIAMLQGGWLLVQQRPWLGHGPGMTPFVYPQVRAKLVGGVETSFQIHNGPLQLWIDHGLLGLLTAIALAAVLLHGALRWLKSPPCALRTFALASAYSLAGYFVMFVTDYQLNVLAFVVALGLHAGLALASPTAKSCAVPTKLQWVGGVVLVMAIVGLIVLIPAWRARHSFWSAWTTDAPTETLARLEQTVAIAPSNPYYLNQLALRRARAAETTAEPAVASQLRARARDELAHSLALDSTPRRSPSTLLSAGCG